MKFSIIIPAHNEEKFIGGCLESIRRAAAPYPGDVEIIVVLNRCTDGTERIAVEAGAKIVHEDAKSLSRIRNAGARQAAGEVLVTIDADSRMAENMLTEIDRALVSGKYIGGGVPIRPDRRSTGIVVTLAILNFFMWVTGLAGGSYWCRRSDFEALGGFNEKLFMGEDLEFAQRLKRLGKSRRLRFITLPRAHIVTSMRKFDRFGDWYFLRTVLLQVRRKRLAKWYRGEYQEEKRRFADKYFYEWEEDKKS
ncbi:MAG: glycosyltransferase [Candidatus Aminicenantes bacterium]|nr:glycosyltransferase [Candidatus Aminicenantes bacterium]